MDANEETGFPNVARTTSSEAADTNLNENFETDSLMSLDIIDLTNDCVKDETNIDFESVLSVYRIPKDGIYEPIELEDFYRNYVFSQHSESKDDEINTAIESLTNDTTEKSIKEFENIFQSYNINLDNINNLDEDINQIDSFCSTPLCIEVPVEFPNDDDVNFGTSKDNNTEEMIQLRDIEPISLKTISLKLESQASHVDAEEQALAFGDKNIDTNDNIITLDSECEGYHSSDFEFITENEAEQGGLITKTKSNEKENKNTPKKFEKGSSSKAFSESSVSNTVDEHDKLKYWSKGYNRALRIRQYGIDMKRNRENHVIPEGDAYLNLFQDAFATTDMFRENKAVVTPSCMTVPDIEFNMNLYREGPIDDQFRKEAEETKKKILERYSTENRKRRRRFI